MLTVQQVDTLLNHQKKTVSPMAWKPIKHRNTIEYQTSIAMMRSGEIIESLRLLCVYTPMPNPAHDYYSFTLLFNNQRVYALDKENEFKLHRNRQAGFGRKHYGETINGSHEHTWSEEGYGYAEPFTLGSNAIHKDYWNYVTKRTNIALTGAYSHPTEGTDGQLSLLFSGG